MSLLYDFVSSLYTIMSLYVVIYPLVTSVMWIVFSIYYKIHWEGHTHERYESHEPTVSVVVPSYNEEKGIVKGLQAILAMEYPYFEVVMINDGSSDRTLDVCKPFLSDPRFRIINKINNQGKALALNDALPCLNGDIVVTMDADAEPEPHLLKNLVWQFQFARVGAVTGHPRVKNVVNLLTRIQVVEFSSIIGLLRRSQRILGRVATVSGIIAAFRKEALYDVQGFSPDMYTEDIDITWRLQRRFWDVRYEPRAIVWMDVPVTLSDFFKQRLRWARGLMQVIRRHLPVITHWKTRKMWAIYYESCLSTLWCMTFGIAFVTEMIRFLISLNLSQPMNMEFQWIFGLFTASLIQLFIGVFMELKHDKDVWSFAPYAIFYPLFYWIFMVVITLTALPVLIRPYRKVKWSSTRR